MNIDLNKLTKAQLIALVEELQSYKEVANEEIDSLHEATRDLTDELELAKADRDEWKAQHDQVWAELEELRRAN